MQTRRSPLARLPYIEYLQSSHWRKTRAEAVARAKWTCQRCGSFRRRLEVHHKTYDRLGAERPDDLITLCQSCHAEVHDGKPLKLPRKKTLEQKALNAWKAQADKLAADEAIRKLPPVSKETVLRELEAFGASLKNGEKGKTLSRRCKKLRELALRADMPEIAESLDKYRPQPFSPSTAIFKPWDKHSLAFREGRKHHLRGPKTGP